MKNPFAKPRCPHGKDVASFCRDCPGRESTARATWLWGDFGMPHFPWFLMGFLGGAVIIFGVVGAIGATATYVASSRECTRFENLSGAETDYDFIAGGCFVETEDGNWVTLDTYKNQFSIKVR